MKKILAIWLIAIMAVTLSSCSEKVSDIEETYSYGSCVKCGNEGTKYVRTAGTKNIYYCDEHYHEIYDSIVDKFEDTYGQFN